VSRCFGIWTTKRGDPWTEERSSVEACSLGCALDFTPVDLCALDYPFVSLTIRAARRGGLAMFVGFCCALA